ncbi:hypothetical protein THASP1DRAFT_31852 [Thamnocephalis sphaerospora]|uniref:Uncharacterized protein n=1 Tax=Thamnocephalis sphaerospora TaxID=78915 RepID=A0A4V1IW50_9FUNG|nr:hypothetical protein THASP1DRAFT_31852 [Thamnocephalis sphaerospora]|eukprot:RKP06329.1 hypothetical protein THASP1DRAFT_31852 [Thamnocephalis sphaerospora]
MATDSARVQVYYTSLLGSRTTHAAVQQVRTTLEMHEIPYQLVDFAFSEEDKLYMRRNNGGNTELVQIFVDGEFRGPYSKFKEAIEDYEVESFLALDKPKVDELEAIAGGEMPSEAELLALLEEEEAKDAATKAGAETAVKTQTTTVKVETTVVTETVTEAVTATTLTTEAAGEIKAAEAAEADSTN